MNQADSIWKTNERQKLFNDAKKLLRGLSLILIATVVLLVEYSDEYDGSDGSLIKFGGTR